MRRTITSLFIIISMFMSLAEFSIMINAQNHSLKPSTNYQTMASSNNNTINTISSVNNNNTDAFNSNQTNINSNNNDTTENGKTKNQSTESTEQSFALNENNQRQASYDRVFGIRWSLDDQYMSISQSNSIKCLVLMFNSFEEISSQGEIYIKIHNQKYTCTSKELTLQTSDSAKDQQNSKPFYNLTTFIFRCYIELSIQPPTTAPPTNPSNEEYINSTSQGIQYFIMRGVLELEGQNIDTYVKSYTEEILFNNYFRFPILTPITKIITIGDWGIIPETITKQLGYLTVDQCLNRVMSVQDSNITAILFTGDLGYQFHGDKYYKMLKQLEPFSSRVPFMISPGNHDTMHEDDTFRLLVETFHAPKWEQYLNYFYYFTIGKVAFISYNPEYQLYGQAKTKIDINFAAQGFTQQLTPDLIHNFHSYFVVVFSHYPLYCSSHLNNNKQVVDCPDILKSKLSNYLSILNQIQYDLYIAGHVHRYQRTKPLCSNGTLLQSKAQFQQSKASSYDEGCPIYIIEGVGGNQVYMEMQPSMQSKNITNTILYNTGFGIITLNNNSRSNKPTSVRYDHYSVKSCQSEDSFTIEMHTDNKNDKNPNKNDEEPLTIFGITARGYFIMMQILLVVSFLIFLGYILFTIRKRRASQRNNAQNNIELVEEQFQIPNNLHSNRQHQSHHSQP